MQSKGAIPKTIFCEMGGKGIHKMVYYGVDSVKLVGMLRFFALFRRLARAARQQRQGETGTYVDIG